MGLAQSFEKAHQVLSSIQSSKRKRRLSLSCKLLLAWHGGDGQGWRRGPSWSYLHGENGSTSSYITSSSRSGTTVSTAYTSGASCHSSGISTESALMQLESQLGMSTSWIETDEKDAELAQPLEKPRNETGETLKEKKMKHVKNMVQEFFSAPSANCSNEDDDMNVLERWFTELGVAWVLLHVADYAAVWVFEHPTIDEI